MNTEVETRKRSKPRRISPAELPRAVNALLSPAQVCAAIGKTDREFRRMRSAGTFPPPESPPGERPKWKTSTVNQWIEDHYRGQRVPTPGQ